MPAGQGVGGIDEILPVAEIMRRLVEGARGEINRLAALRSDFRLQGKRWRSPRMRPVALRAGSAWSMRWLATRIR